MSLRHRSSSGRGTVFERTCMERVPKGSEERTFVARRGLAHDCLNGEVRRPQQQRSLLESLLSQQSSQRNTVYALNVPANRARALFKRRGKLWRPRYGMRPVAQLQVFLDYARHSLLIQIGGRKRHGSVLQIQPPPVPCSASAVFYVFVPDACHCRVNSTSNDLAELPIPLLGIGPPQ